MDTSKEYIKMCEKAVEIQKIFKIRGLGENDFINREKNNPKRKGFIIVIWLPRQDQLQGMVFEKEDANASGLIERFNNVLATWAECGYGDNKADPSNFSMEQLWLAFVMSEKYNKVWNGKDWINAK